MERSLYGPDGYYASGAAKSGKDGDYFTAPDVGAAFGELLAAIFKSWKQKLKSDSFSIMEVGAGEGRLAMDILSSFRRKPSPIGDSPYLYPERNGTEPSAPGPRHGTRGGGDGDVRYIAVERSPSRQEALKKHSPIEVYPDLGLVPPMEGVLFGNELIDAFAVHRVRMKNGRLEEGYVGGASWRPCPTQPIEPMKCTEPAKSMKSLESMQSVDPAISDESYGQGRQLAPPTILWGPPSTPRLQSYLDRLGIVLPEDYETEVNLAMADWLKEASRVLQKGLLLLIDYGRPAYDYYAPERTGGTLRCFRGHQVSDPFLSSSPAATGGGPMGPRLGHSGATSLDWTSDVDFTSLALDAREEGFVPLAFMEMGSFLLAGAELLLRNGTLEVPSPLEGGAMNGGLRYLLHPEGMGAAFHVLILGRNIDSAEWTFEHNRLRRLQLPAPSIRPPEWRPLIDGHRHPDEKGERR